MSSGVDRNQGETGPVCVALYVRSSKDSHAVSCKSQLVELRKRIEQEGEREVEYREDSGVSYRDADGLLELLALARQKPSPFEKLYVYDTARISRDAAWQGGIIREFERAGVQLVIYTLPSTGDRPADNLLRTVYGGFDQLHSERSAEGSRRGQRQNIRGGWRAGGPPPYGYKIERNAEGKNKRGEPVFKGRLVPHADEAPVVREIFGRVAAGESYRAIADDLTARRVCRKRGSTNWKPDTVSQILDNWRVYQGDLIWNKRSYVKGPHSPTLTIRMTEPSWEVCEAAHEAIISAGLAKTVISGRPTSREHRPRKRTTNPFKGILFCGLCGAKLYAHGKTRRGHGRLYCARRRPARGECDLPTVSTRLVIVAILGALSGQIKELGGVEGVARRLVELENQPKSSPLRLIEARLKRLTAEIKNLEAGLAVVGNPRDAARLTKEKLNPRHKERDDFETQRAALLAEHPEPLTLARVLPFVRDFLGDLEKTAADAPPELLRRLFDGCLERVEVHPARDGTNRHTLKIQWIPPMRKSPTETAGEVCGFHEWTRGDKGKTHTFTTEAILMGGNPGKV